MSALLRSALTAVTITALTLLGLVLASSAAGAPRCGDGCPTLSARTITPAAGAQLTVVGTDFGGSDRVTFSLHGAPNPLGWVQTNALGAFRTTISLPARITGRHAIVASEPATGQQAVQVLRISGANDDAVADAGERSRGYVGVAVIGLSALFVVLMIGGGLLLLLAARRRQASA